MEVTNAPSSRRPGGNQAEVDVRMTEQQPQQLTSGISRSARHCRLDRHAAELYRSLYRSAQPALGQVMAVGAGLGVSSSATSTTAVPVSTSCSARFDPNKDGAQAAPTSRIPQSPLPPT